MAKKKKHQVISTNNQDQKLVLQDPVIVKLIPFEENRLSISDKINIGTTILSLFTIIIAIVTVLEMRADRKAAYHPDILLNPVTYSFTWDEHGNETGLYKGHIGETNSDIENYGFILLPVANVGIGAAKEIVFEWDSNNTQQLIDFLVTFVPDKKDFCKVNDNFTLFFDDGKIFEQISNPRQSEQMYMLPSTSNDETYTISFPYVYTKLIHEILKCERTIPYNPYVNLTISCKDSINNIVKKEIRIEIRRVRLHLSTDDSGQISYELVPIYTGE